MIQITKDKFTEPTWLIHSVCEQAGRKIKTGLQKLRVDVGGMDTIPDLFVA